MAGMIGVVICISMLFIPKRIEVKPEIAVFQGISYNELKYMMGIEAVKNKNDIYKAEIPEHNVKAVFLTSENYLSYFTKCCYVEGTLGALMNNVKKCPLKNLFPDFLLKEKFQHILLKKVAVQSFIWQIIM